MVAVSLKKKKKKKKKKKNIIFFFFKQKTAYEMCDSDWSSDVCSSDLSVQAAFDEAFALQCGYCTPGFVLTALAYLEDDPDADREAIRSAVAGNACRCTGYETILDAIESVAEDRD